MIVSGMTSSPLLWELLVLIMNDLRLQNRSSMLTISKHHVTWPTFSYNSWLTKTGTTRISGGKEVASTLTRSTGVDCVLCYTRRTRPVITVFIRDWRRGGVVQVSALIRRQEDLDTPRGELRWRWAIAVFISNGLRSDIHLVIFRRLSTRDMIILTRSIDSYLINYTKIHWSTWLDSTPVVNDSTGLDSNGKWSTLLHVTWS